MVPPTCLCPPLPRRAHVCAAPQVALAGLKELSPAEALWLLRVLLTARASLPHSHWRDLLRACKQGLSACMLREGGGPVAAPPAGGAAVPAPGGVLTPRQARLLRDLVRSSLKKWGGQEWPAWRRLQRALSATSTECLASWE